MFPTFIKSTPTLNAKQGLGNVTQSEKAGCIFIRQMHSFNSFELSAGKSD
jgi:hypothetical protein